MELLTPETVEQRKKDLLEKTISLADQGNSFAQYIVGTLYRMGDDHPAKVVKRDLDKAELYLSNAAIQGELGAMAGMAQIKLNRGQPGDGLIWAWAFVEFGSKKDDATSSDKLVDQYAEYLFSRCMNALGPAGQAKMKEFDQYSQAFYARYGERILKRVKGNPVLITGGGPEIIFEGESVLPAPSGFLAQRFAYPDFYPGYATLLVQIDPTGKAVNAAVIDAEPNGAVGAYFARQVLTRVKYNRLPEQLPQVPRYGIQPFSTGWRGVPESKIP